jgi:hypothetical protein
VSNIRYELAHERLLGASTQLQSFDRTREGRLDATEAMISSAPSIDWISAFSSPLPPHDARVHAVAHMVSSTFAEGELIPGAERHEKFSIS